MPKSSIFINAFGITAGWQSAKASHSCLLGFMNICILAFSMMADITQNR